MKNKLEIKHLTPYLPYGLKAEMLDCNIDYTGEKYDEIRGVYQLGDNNWHCETIKGSRPSINNIKPILRPLSDFNNEIEINGKKIIPLEEVLRNSFFNIDLMKERGEDLEGYIEVCLPPHTSFNDIFLLLEWNFDVFSLIDRGLAIDINTINNGS